MPTNRYSISDAHKNLTQLLVRANHGEEILIMRGDDVYARIGPAESENKRPFGLLRKRGLPDGLFDAAPRGTQSMLTTELDGKHQ